MEIKQELKLIKALNKILDPAQEPVSNHGDETIEIARMDLANVVLFKAKNIEARRILSRFIEKEAAAIKVPELDYTNNNGKGKYSTEYVSKIMDVMNILNESVKLTSAYEYPMTIENDYFKVILAPRLDND